MPTRWSLFVDESGEFTPDDPSFLVGILAEADAGTLDGGWLRRKLADAWGPGPYPPHAAHLRWPASRVLYSARARGWSKGMVHGRFAVRLQPICEALASRLECTSFSERLAAIRFGVRPTWDDIRAAVSMATECGWLEQD